MVGKLDRAVVIDRHGQTAAKQPQLQEANKDPLTPVDPNTLNPTRNKADETHDTSVSGVKFDGEPRVRDAVQCSQDNGDDKQYSQRDLEETSAKNDKARGLLQVQVEARVTDVTETAGEPGNPIPDQQGHKRGARPMVHSADTRRDSSALDRDGDGTSIAYYSYVPHEIQPFTAQTVPAYGKVLIHGENREKDEPRVFMVPLCSPKPVPVEPHNMEDFGFLQSSELPQCCPESQQRPQVYHLGQLGDSGSYMILDEPDHQNYDETDDTGELDFDISFDGLQLDDEQNMEMPALNNNNVEEPGLCAGCGGKIVERYYLLAVDKQWHANCLKCSCCNVTLDSELTCFAKDGQIFCKEDYYRRFAVKRCARCQMGISANELVMRARDCVYHLNCFSCFTCSKVLATGDHFGMKDTMIFCKLHYELDSPQPPLSDPNSLTPPGHPGHPDLPHSGHPSPTDYPNQPPPGLPMPGPGMHNFSGGGSIFPGDGSGVPFHADQKPPPPTTQLPFYNGVGAAQKGRPRKRKSPMPVDCHPGDPTGMHGLGMDPHDPNNQDPFFQYGRDMAKQKRMRTSFKHHQLRAMKAYFAVNHNPDAKDLKQLSEKTGLPKKVLQVWFQNARAKYRRNLLKQDDKPGDKTATSPKMGDEAGRLPDMPRSRSPSGMSDVSSSPSLSDLHSTSMDGQTHLGGGPMQTSHQVGPMGNPSLSELFSSSISTMS